MTCTTAAAAESESEGVYTATKIDRDRSVAMHKLWFVMIESCRTNKVNVQPESRLARTVFVIPL